MMTVRTYRNLFHAQSAKAILESKGIRVFLKNENVAGLNLFYARALGDIELQVDEENIARVLKILGPEENYKDEVDQISKRFGRIFRYSLGIGLLAVIIQAGINGFEAEQIFDSLEIALLLVIASMIALSFLFREKE